jgi:Asp-tRNA(Asn)/Glu-tRNA(Gln) amidotransferase C subunit
MSAVPQSCSPTADANRIRREIERLSHEQTKALERAMRVDVSPAEQNQYDHRHREIVDLLSQLTALDAGNVSRVSAKMVELSLQEPQRDPTLQDTRKSGPVSSPLLWLPNDAQGITSPSFEDPGKKGSAVRRPVAAATHLNLQQANATPRTRIIQRSFTFARRIIGPLALSAGRSGIRQRTGSLIARLSTARTAQFLVDRLSAIKVYRCRDCGREVGFRSRRRTFIECYILPLFLVQPIRCAACFRRDYWSIITTVRKRSHRDVESPDCTLAHAA